MGEPENSALPSHIEASVRALAELHADHHRRATPTQRAVERLIQLVGRPRFVGAVAGFVALWIVCNLILQTVGRAFDPPPFQWLQDMAGVAALVITLLILITQRRENELAEHRAQLTLELVMLNEQRSAKLIGLLEELRRDMPDIADRHDPEAEALAVPADPQVVSEAIKGTHEEALAAVAEEVIPP